MKKKQSLYLSIPEPCTQAWDDMQPVQGGRHCASCRKMVVDFTRMTDAQLLDYFNKYQGKVCGRLHADQAGRLIVPVQVQPSRWWARVAAGLLLALGLSKATNGQTKQGYNKIEVAPEPIKPVVEDANRPEASGDTLEVYGTLKDEKGNPITNATVIIYLDKRSCGSTITDFDGHYSLRVAKNNLIQYDVKFAFQGNDITIMGVLGGQEKIQVNATLVTTNERIRMVGCIRTFRRPIINLEQPAGMSEKTGVMIDNAP